jgi:adenine-specific DNA-methyltransferase
MVPVLEAVCAAAGARTALDLFSGTGRVGMAFKRAGAAVTAVDSARYAYVLAAGHVATDPDRTDLGALAAAIAERWAGHDWEPVLLTSLLEAADRVDSTTGVQMAYLKQWAPRATRPLALRVPDLVPGPGRAVHGDAVALAGRLGGYDLAYLDPPYNQHSYLANYHVWETIVADDRPDHYGVACKRADTRAPDRASPFNRRRHIAGALAAVLDDLDAGVVALSYNDESWIDLDELRSLLAGRGAVEVVAFDAPRYVGARIGIHDPAGRRVGTVGRTRNVEWLLLAGPGPRVRRLAAAARAATPLGATAVGA